MKTYLIEFFSLNYNETAVYVDAYSKTEAQEYLECNYEFDCIKNITEVDLGRIF